METTGTRYGDRGVSTSKGDVHRAIAGQDAGLFPGAFCKILPDIAGDPDYCTIVHADGAGTKTAMAYIAWREGFGLKVWKGIVQDSLVMNSDDLGCVGALGPFFVSTMIDRNKHVIPGDVIATIIGGCGDFCNQLTDLGITCTVTGGETADVGDLVRTITVNNVIVCRMRRDAVIDASRMVPGDLIVGFSSTGQATWETEPNSGIGSNGLTSGRHDALLHAYAEKYPETFAPETAGDLVYQGKHNVTDPLPGDDRFNVASALLSPTRTYLPLIKMLCETLGPHAIHGLIHCSGGGQSKIQKFGALGNLYVKDNLFPVPPLLDLLHDAGTSWEEMHEVYSMGHRLEAVVPTTEDAIVCIFLAKSCGIGARVIGSVEKGIGLKRRVIVESEHGTFTYPREPK